MNVQVACTLSGRLAWISDAIEGSRHDTHRIKESEALVTLDPTNWIGDKGYVGNDMLTPIKKPPHRELLDWEKEFNKKINKIRYVIEQVIAHFKDSEIMHTDYRRPLTPSPRPSPQSSPCTSINSALNKPLCRRYLPTEVFELLGDPVRVRFRSSGPGEVIRSKASARPGRSGEHHVTTTRRAPRYMPPAHGLVQPTCNQRPHRRSR